MGRKQNTKIWNYFEQVSEHKVKCKHCKVDLSCKHTSANLVRHLYLRHRIDATSEGAERTEFLKRRSKIKSRSSDIEHEITDDTSFNPLDNVKLEAEILMTDMGKNSDYIDEEEYIDRVTTSPHPLCEFEIDDLASPESPTQIMIADLNVTHNSKDGSNVTDCNATKCKSSSRTESSCRMEKLQAEARYYHELADLARAKRNFIELQTKKMKFELNKMIRNTRVQR